MSSIIEFLPGGEIVLLNTFADAAPGKSADAGIYGFVIHGREEQLKRLDFLSTATDLDDLDAYAFHAALCWAEKSGESAIILCSKLTAFLYHADETSRQQVELDSRLWRDIYRKKAEVGYRIQVICKVTFARKMRSSGQSGPSFTDPYWRLIDQS